MFLSNSSASEVAEAQLVRHGDSSDAFPHEVNITQLKIIAKASNEAIKLRFINFPYIFLF